MQLRDWLAETGTKYAAFAARIGVANASVVKKYVDGRVPRSGSVMAAIVRETGGKVQPNDFFTAAAE